MKRQHPNFPGNLRIASSQYSSVAAVCRSLEINRQQFNKYLSGQVYPNQHNLQRICHFFGISAHQFDLSEAEFKLSLVSCSEEVRQVNPIEKVIDSLPNASEILERYVGYYYSHFYALGYPGSIIRSLIHLYQVDNHFYTKSIEHLWNKEKGHRHRDRFKYSGMVFYLGDRIFITEYEMLAKNAICHTILFPNYRYKLDTLSGITSGVGSLNSHMPKATRIELQYLGQDIDLRQAIKGCGLFDIDSKTISAEIRNRIDNQVSADEFMLTARDQ